MEMQCAWCLMLQDLRGNYTRVGTALQTTPATSHGVCPSCFVREMAAVAAWKANR